MLNTFKIVAALCLLQFFSSCEEEIDYELRDSEEVIVVEGYIENNLPPIVLLSNSFSLNDKLTLEFLESKFIHDAEIIISNNGVDYPLTEIRIDTALEQAENFLRLYGSEFDIDEIPKISIYTTPLLFGEPDQQYDLLIRTDGKKLTSTTTIPPLIELEDVYFNPHPNPEKDTLVSLNILFRDVPGVNNYQRVFTQRNQEGFYTPLVRSVLDDNSIVQLDGESFSFPIDRGISPFEEIEDFTDISYFNVGDTVRVRWSSIDKAHYDFWNTLETNETQVGNPFGRPVAIESNINGGVGIWGGYATIYYQRIARVDSSTAE